ncbi:MAG: glycosyltransferase family 4 protein [archaeon]
MRNTLFITNGSTNHKILELCASFSDKLIILRNKKYEFEFGFELRQISKHKEKMRIYYAKSSLNLFKRARQIVKKENINLIITHCPISSNAGVYTKMFKKNRVIFIMCQDFIEYNKETIQNPLSKTAKTLMLHLLLRIACRQTDVVALSNYVKNKAEHYGAKNVNVIPVYGVDTKEFTKKKTNLRKKYKLENKKVILTASRLSPEKGVDCTIRAMKEIIEKIPQATLVITAKGNYRPELEKLANKLKLNNHVVFTGEIPRKNMPEYYSMADVFVMPSFKEGLGFSAAEAMACETPVVASNVGGISDTVIHNKTGIMVEPRKERAIAEAIIKLLEDKKLAKKLAENGRKHVMQNFEEHLVNKKFSEFVNNPQPYSSQN